jgi:putative ABC transport system permease protein
MKNIKLALRTLFKTPFVTTVAVASLALGIGANAAIYSLFDQMLLRPLPVRAPEQLVNLSAPGPKPGSQSCSNAGSCELVFSYPMFRDLEQKQQVLTGLAAHVDVGVNLSYRGQTENGDGMLVSGSYFPVLGLKPAIGRLLTPEDDRAIGGNFITVLSYSYWQSRLGANPAVVGDQIMINGQSMTIIGVAPPDFDGTTLGERPFVFIPVTMRGLMIPGWRGFDNRQSYWLYVFGRLKPGVTLQQAQRGLNSLYQPIVNDVEAPLQQNMSAQTMAKFRVKQIGVESGARGQSVLHRQTRIPLLLLFGISGVVLLIACANIANLLLARGANRAMEMAVRLALGASRRQLFLQLLTESCVLALLGGLLSLVVARVTLHGALALLPADTGASLHPELRVPILIFAALMAIGTGLLFGFFPALHSTRPDLVSTIRANTGQLSSARGSARFRSALVTAQIALSMALLISAGLFIKSLANVSRVDLGVKVDNVVTFGLSPQLNGYTTSRARALFQQVEEALTTLPGVTGAAASMVPLLSGSNWGTSVSVQGFQAGPDTDNGALYNEISAGYFHTLGVPLLAGREFTASDVEGAPQVAIVNEEFARKFNLGHDVVGKMMAQGRRAKTLNTQIVGLVRNVAYSDVKQKPEALFFMPYRQDTTLGFLHFYVSAARSPEQLLRSLPAVVKRFDANLPIEDLKTMPQQIRQNVYIDRMISLLSSAFAALATLLAAVGLYGVLAYTVSRRTREIGVRMALGANASRVRAMVLRQVAMMTLVGVVIGLAVALALGKTAQSLLFGMEAHDPTVIAGAIAVLTIVALGAGFLPAYRASTVDPIKALRYE